MSWILTSRSSPASSPSQPGDRFIPYRTRANWSLKFHTALEDSEKPLKEKRKSRGAASGNSKGALTYSALLQNELLGAGIEKVQDLKRGGQRLLQPGTPEKKKLFVYSPSPTCCRPDVGSETSPYSLASISNQSQTLLMSQEKPPRIIPSKSFKVLEAPDLENDVCLNLLDWSSLNVISVGLGTCAFLWNADTLQVSQLCDLSVERDSVTSLCWSNQGNLLALGTDTGYVQIWDVAAEKKVSVLDGHRSRVGVLAWNEDQISSGSRDTMIIQRDFRTPPRQSERRLRGHAREVCRLQWSTNHRLLASSGKDSTILLWNLASLKPVQHYAHHRASVRAIAWSPHQHGLLASTSGKVDCSIHFWNSLTEQTLQRIHTDSQVFNMAWSKNSNELVSTHGYSENQIAIWKYPSLTQVAKLKGHKNRVLYLTMSPDGQVIATGAADETLRFWKVFAPTRPSRPSASVLDLFGHIR
ncbi:fizzy-related protein homolog [Trichosurus vulpecula]|uniref:fizzy-related protein homolog n=1 Tax=Trichosurus vulpecula TaxID=9337 RepID=UPI00186AD7A9|nr:fizzy-related protein homolog [Trichosurus vulpecula]